MSSQEKSDRQTQFNELCRKRGLAMTVQRRIIWEAIQDRTDHPTADQVFEDVSRRLPGLSRTTVYRVLDTLVEIGVINKACSPGSATRFDPMTRRHHHLVCNTCERLTDLDDDQIDVSVTLPSPKAHSFLVQDFSIHFQGICAECRQRQAEWTDHAIDDAAPGINAGADHEPTIDAKRRKSK